MLAVGPDSGRIERDRGKMRTTKQGNEVCRAGLAANQNHPVPIVPFRCRSSDTPHGTASILLFMSFTPHRGIDALRWAPNLKESTYRHTSSKVLEAASTHIGRGWYVSDKPRGRGVAAFYMLWQKLPDELRMHICPGGQPPSQPPALSATAAPCSNHNKHTHTHTQAG